MQDIIIAIVILAILGLAAGYVIRARKNGQKCIGCPNGRTCAHRGSCPNCSSAQSRM